MTAEAYKIVLKNDGWNVEPEGGFFFGYKYATKATAFNFETEDAAWEWLKTFLQSLPGVGIGANLDN